MNNCTFVDITHKIFPMIIKYPYPLLVPTKVQTLEPSLQKINKYANIMYTKHDTNQLVWNTKSTITKCKHKPAVITQQFDTTLTLTMAERKTDCGTCVSFMFKRNKYVFTDN